MQQKGEKKEKYEENEAWGQPKRPSSQSITGYFSGQSLRAVYPPD